MHSPHSACRRGRRPRRGRRGRGHGSPFVLGERGGVSPFPHEKMSVWHMAPDSPAGEAWWGRGQKRREAGRVCGMPVLWLLPQAVRPPARPPASPVAVPPSLPRPRPQPPLPHSGRSAPMAPQPLECCEALAPPPSRVPSPFPDPTPTHFILPSPSPPPPLPAPLTFHAISTHALICSLPFQT